MLKKKQKNKTYYYAKLNVFPFKFVFLYQAGCYFVHSSVTACSHCNHIKKPRRNPNEKHIAIGWPHSNCFLLCLRLRFFPTSTTSNPVTISHSWTFFPVGYICTGTTWSNHFVSIDQEAVAKRSLWYQYVDTAVVWSPDGEISPA